MQSKTTLFLLFSLTLTVGYLPSVTAVTDAELEALEKQIEQLEAEEKKKTEEAAKRNVEQKRKAKAEAKRKAEAEAEKQANEKRKQEAGEKHIAEEETKRQEEVKQAKAEEQQQKSAIPCAPRLLDARPSDFPEIKSAVYDYPALNNIPVPKIRWAKFNTKTSVTKGNHVVSQSNNDEKVEYIEYDGVFIRRIFSSNHSSQYENNTPNTFLSTNDNVSYLAGLKIAYMDYKSKDYSSKSDSIVTNVSGELFPLKLDNTLTIETKHGENNGIYPRTAVSKYKVVDVIDGGSLNMGISCNIYVIEDYTIEQINDKKWDKTYKYYFSEQLGIFVEQSYIKGSSFSNDQIYTSEKKLVDYGL